MTHRWVRVHNAEGQHTLVLNGKRVTLTALPLETLTSYFLPLFSNDMSRMFRFAPSGAAWPFGGFENKLVHVSGSNYSHFTKALMCPCESLFFSRWYFQVFLQPAKKLSPIISLVFFPYDDDPRSPEGPLADLPLSTCTRRQSRDSVSTGLHTSAGR